MKPLRLPFCAALLAAALYGTAVSFVGAQAVGAHARDLAAQSSPEALVRQVAAQMLEAGGSATLAEEKMLAHVDFAEAARLAAGAVWTQASAAQQMQLAAAFRRVLVRGFIQALAAHDGRTLAVDAPRAADRTGDGITVQSRLERRDGAPLPVEYALRRRGGEWKIYDIRVDGESLVDACRPLFERIARTEGVAGLIKRMKGTSRAKPAVWA